MGFLANILALHADRRERAFMQWMKSGYRNASAHQEFLEAYEQANKLQRKINQLVRNGR